MSASPTSLFTKRLVQDRVLDQPEVWVICHRVKVPQSPGAQVIKPDDLFSRCEQRLDQVGPDETGCAGNHDPLHHSSTAWTGRLK